MVRIRDPLAKRKQRVKKRKSKTSKKKIADETTKCNPVSQTNLQISSGITRVDDNKKNNKQLTKSTKSLGQNEQDFS